ncbi:hypothetical protein RchiOBHm_Chr5g0078271 [Rosa chinensis]|uniref:Uncharacterized protein n=1 Tax=Rosa chinensis TaxID=74649 RepID=A0A2P6QM69_ROSCH|nr:hypothetical protein RchiOBHm_Chr5g0078271 [Rosa chinensis]
MDSIDSINDKFGVPFHFDVIEASFLSSSKTVTQSNCFRHQNSSDTRIFCSGKDWFSKMVSNYESYSCRAYFNRVIKVDLDCILCWGSPRDTV